MARKNQRAATTTATETPAEAFSRLGGKRTGKAILAIRTVGKCANKTSYSYTKAQADKIVAALRAEVDAVEAQFAEGKASPSGVNFQV